MNPTKLLDDIVSAITRHGPTIVVNLVLFVWVGLRVLDPARLPSGDAFWLSIEHRIDSSLLAIGLHVERWYVIATLVIAYLVTFRGVRGVLLNLRPFRVPYPRRQQPEILAEAAQTFRMRPGEVWRIRQALTDRVEELNREVREAGGRHPYEWQNQRVNTFYTYYGTLLVMLALSTLWLLQGATYARSSARVWELVLLTALACLALRLTTKREIARRETALAYWALRQSKGAADGRRDPLEAKRRDIVQQVVKFEQAVANHPSQLLSRLAFRWMPQKWANRVSARLQPPGWWAADRDWDLLESAAMLQAEEEQPPPRALRVDSFLGRFDALLECPGAGLCVLVPPALGLAPSVCGAGASYSLAARQHGVDRLALRLEANPDYAGARIAVDSWRDRAGFLVEVGDFPVERLAQHEFPPTRDWVWQNLVEKDLDPESWQQLGEGKAVEVAGLTLAPSTELHPGSSYLLGARTELSTRVVAAFQCFRLVHASGLLIAWRILRVNTEQAVVPEVLPWWKPAAWQEVFRPAEHARA